MPFGTEMTEEVHVVQEPEQQDLFPDTTTVSSILKVKNELHESVCKQKEEAALHAEKLEDRRSDLAIELTRLSEMLDEFGDIPYAEAYPKWRFHECEGRGGCTNVVDQECMSTGGRYGFMSKRWICSECAEHILGEVPDNQGG